MKHYIQKMEKRVWTCSFEELSRIPVEQIKLPSIEAEQNEIRINEVQHIPVRLDQE